MIYKNFRINIIFRIILIFALAFAGIYIAFSQYFWMVSIWIGLAVVLLIIELIRYLEKSRRELGLFLHAISQGDFSLHYAKNKKHKKQKDFHCAYSLILDTMRKLRDEKEIQFQYLQNVITHIRVALICFDKDYRIHLLNDAAKELFQRQHMNSINVFSHIDRNLKECIQTIRSKEKELIKIVIEDELYHLSVQAIEFKLQETEYKLVSFQDIKTELEEQEILAWQKLIRVLTHEINNSVIPISNLDMSYYIL